MKFKTSFLMIGLFVGGVAMAESSGYSVQKTMSLPGDDGWDYLTCDGTARRLYIAHGTQVLVMDLDPLTLIGKIPDTHGVHGIALAPELGRGFTSNGKDGTVTIFDLTNLKPLGLVTAGKNPDSIVYDPASQRVFAFNGKSQDATVFQAKDGKAVGTVPLGGKPEFSVADGQGAVFVNLEDKGLLLRVNSQSLAIEQRWPVAPCEEPSSLAMDRANRRLFAGCGNKTMIVVDADSGKVLASLPIGDHVDATVFDPDQGLVFNANGEGTITVIHEDAPDRFHVVENVPTQKGARTIALDTKTHRLFLVTAQFGPKPAATALEPRPRPPIIPGTFTLLVVDQKPKGGSL